MGEASESFPQTQQQQQQQDGGEKQQWKKPGKENEADAEAAEYNNTKHSSPSALVVFCGDSGESIQSFNVINSLMHTHTHNTHTYTNTHTVLSPLRRALVIRVNWIGK